MTATNYAEIRIRITEQLKDMSLTTTQELYDKFLTLIGTEKHGLSMSEKSQMFSVIATELLGDDYEDPMALGAIEPLLHDPSVIEIMVNGLDAIYVERNGRMEKTEHHFENEDQLYDVINRIAKSVGRIVNESHPVVDMRLADGSRVNVVIPPIALTGPTMTIRRFPNKKLTWEELIGFGSISESGVKFLEACVGSGLNIVVAGGTGSGKTTIFNALTDFISEKDRVVTIETAGELRVDHPHVIRMETRPANIEGKGEVSSSFLVGNAMKMRPDRILCAEVNGDEAWDMINAMSVGYEGSMFTIHADNPRDVLARLEGMCINAQPGIPVMSIRQHLVNAIDLIVQQQRLRDGSRKIIAITEIRQMRNNMIEMADIFAFEQTDYENGRIIGELRPTGVIPSTIEHLAHAGYTLDEAFFQAEDDA